MKVKISLGERTINKLFYGTPPPRKAGGLARDKWAFDILNEAFDEVRKESGAALASARAGLEAAKARNVAFQSERDAEYDELTQMVDSARALAMKEAAQVVKPDAALELSAERAARESMRQERNKARRYSADAARVVRAAVKLVGERFETSGDELVVAVERLLSKRKGRKP